MLTQVYQLLITQLHIFSINFINVLSIRYLVFPALFPSISMLRHKAGQEGRGEILLENSFMR